MVSSAQRRGKTQTGLYQNNDAVVCIIHECWNQSFPRDNFMGNIYFNIVLLGQCIADLVKILAKFCKQCIAVSPNLGLN